MKSLFSTDSILFRVMSRVADLMLLNIIFLISCLPVVTIGAAMTAMYTVCFRMDTDREQGIFSVYFRAFRDNWKQATGIWMLLFWFLCAAVFESILCSRASGLIHYGWLVLALASVLDLMVIAMAFPMISQFENRWKQTLKNALFLSLGHLPTTLCLVFFQVFPLIILVKSPVYFLKIGMFWLLLYFAAAAYVSAKLLRRAFAPFYPQES